MLLFHLGNHCWLSKAHFINSALWCDCLFSKLEDQEAPSIDQTVEALILSPILNISCSHDVQLSEPAKIRVPLTLSDGGIEPMDQYAGQLKIRHFNSSEKSQESTDITDDLDMPAVLKDRKVTFEEKISARNNFVWMLRYCRKCRSSNIHWFISVLKVLKVCRERYKRWVHIIIKFGYNTRCHWLKERALW